MMQTISIRSDRDVARAVALTVRTAERAGLDTLQANAAATAASELARNIVKYAETGHITVGITEADRQTGLRIVATDRGPGIADVTAAVRDHYSTGGTLGLGLPGVKRLMDEVKIDTEPGKGTTVTATLWVSGSKSPGRPSTQPAKPFRLMAPTTVRLEPRGADDPAVSAAGRVQPHRTERVSGDTVALRWIGDHVLVVLIDALGHGASAAKIAERAKTAINAAQSADVRSVMALIHNALRPTDGAAAAVVKVDPTKRTFEGVAVGNIRIRVIGKSDHRLEWAAGTVGTSYRTPTVSHDVLGDDTLLIYSDGVSDHFERSDYPGVCSDSPEVASRIIMERFGKDHDDASCVVLRCGR